MYMISVENDEQLLTILNILKNNNVQYVYLQGKLIFRQLVPQIQATYNVMSNIPEWLEDFFDMQICAEPSSAANVI